MAKKITASLHLSKSSIVIVHISSDGRVDMSIEDSEGNTSSLESLDCDDGEGWRNAIDDFIVQLQKIQAQYNKEE